jgi:hypothetical protein
MYGIPLDGNVRLRTNASLRAYAQLEYPNEDVLWLLASTKATPGTRRTRRHLGLFERRARPSHTPVACKGSPRIEVPEAPSPT